jgi:hypothetical protein
VLNSATRSAGAKAENQFAVFRPEGRLPEHRAEDLCGAQLELELPPIPVLPNPPREIDDDDDEPPNTDDEGDELPDDENVR